MRTVACSKPRGGSCWDHGMTIRPKMSFLGKPASELWLVLASYLNWRPRIAKCKAIYYRCPGSALEPSASEISDELQGAHLALLYHAVAKEDLTSTLFSPSFSFLQHHFWIRHFWNFWNFSIFYSF